MKIPPWKIWFAWYPVQIDDEWVVFRFVERQQWTHRNNKWTNHRLPVKKAAA